MYKKQILNIIRNDKHFSGKNKILVKALGMGENNLNYLITIGKDKYVFRISLKKHLEKNACKEFEFLRYIPQGIAPEPILLDKSKKKLPHYYSILRYIDGKSTNEWDKNKLKIHAHTMATLHSKTFDYWKTMGKKKKVFNLYTKMFKDMNGYKEMLKKKDKQLSQLLNKFKEYIKQNNHYFTELKKFHFIHGDLCADNILFQKNKIRYIDWEWCGIRDNAEDIARVYIKGKSIKPWYVGLDEKEVDCLIDEYITDSRHKDKTIRQRVKIWNNYLLFMDMLYFYWKVDNYDRFPSKLPKSTYEKASKMLFEHFISQQYKLFH